MTTEGSPVTVIKNVASKAWRRATAAPRYGIRLFRRGERLREQATAFREEWRVEAEIAAVARGRGPVIVGPWLSEVGFEVLYWVPFLRWFADRYRVDRERVIVVSRGGVAGWYSDIAARYVEIFDHLSPDDFSRRNRERHQREESGGQKQTSLGSLDTTLIAAARLATGTSDTAICHPSLMYRLFNRFWYGNRALDLVASHTRYVPYKWGRGSFVEDMSSTNDPRPHLPLPERYIAGKFYTGASLPGTSETRFALRELVRAAAARMPVVMLDTGMSTDEHEDYLFRDIPNVTSLRDRLTPNTNLGVQTSVIAGAQGFVGTCGSLAWLAPMLGVDTLAVYSEERFLVSHIFFATQAYRQAGAARFDTLDLRGVTELDLLASVPAMAEGHS